MPSHPPNPRPHEDGPHRGTTLPAYDNERNRRPPPRSSSSGSSATVHVPSGAAYISSHHIILNHTRRVVSIECPPSRSSSSHPHDAHRRPRHDSVDHARSPSGSHPRSTSRDHARPPSGPQRPRAVTMVPAVRSPPPPRQPAAPPRRPTDNRHNPFATALHGLGGAVSHFGHTIEKNLNITWPEDSRPPGSTPDRHRRGSSSGDRHRR